MIDTTVSTTGISNESGRVLIARRFVQLAKKYPDWKQVTFLPNDESQILLDTVRAGGFDVQSVSPGALIHNLRDGHRELTGETLRINKLCPFIAVNQKGDNNAQATGWLDALIALVTQQGQGRKDEELVSAVVIEIGRSIPLKPIKFPGDDGALIENSSSLQNVRGSTYFVNHARDESTLAPAPSSVVGFHEYCGSAIERRKTSATHDVLICRSCLLRIVIPNKITTYGQLRTELSSRLVKTEKVTSRVDTYIG
jgi:hypothetical protein